MKKLLLSLLIVSSVAYAQDKEGCAQAKKVVDKLHQYKKTAVQLDYSSDNAGKAAVCKDAISGLDKNIIVKLNPVSDGKNIFKFHKPD